MDSTEPNDQVLSFLLNGGLDDRAEPGFANPVVTSGSSPTLVKTVNTRLSVVPGSVTRSPEITAAGTPKPAGTDCYGIIPAANGNNALALFTPTQGGAYKLCKAGLSPQGSGQAYSTRILSGYKTNQQNAYLPARIVDAGVVPGVAAVSDVACVYNETLNQVWYAYVGLDYVSYYIYTMVTDASGAILVPPTVASAALGGLGDPYVPWMGLTQHGVNNTGLWYISQTGDVSCQLLSVVDNRLVQSGGMTLYRPAFRSAAYDVTAAGDYAWFIGGSPDNEVDTQIRRIRIPSFAVEDVQTIPNSILYKFDIPDSLSFAITAQKFGADYKLVFAISDSFQIQTRFFCRSFDNTDLHPMLYISDRAGAVACQFHVTPNDINGVYAVSDLRSSFYDGTAAQNNPRMCTTVYSFSLTQNSPRIQTVATLPQQALANRGAWYKVSDTEAYPIFFLNRAYKQNAKLGDPDYTDDPSIEAYLVGQLVDPPYPYGKTSTITPIARFGTVRGVQSPAKTQTTGQFRSNSATMIGGKLFCTYLADNTDQVYASAVGYTGRYVSIDLSPHQPRVAHDKAGVALVAGALPVQYDGVELTEMGCALHGPHVRASTSGGAAAPLDVGIYQLRAVYLWTDAAGLKHRSRPSNLFLLNLPAQNRTPRIMVTVPDSFRDRVNQDTIEVIIYSSGVGGSTIHAQKWIPTIWLNTVEFRDITTPVTSNAQIYSTGSSVGEELTPQPPPPLHDIAIIGPRAWGIDAEVRTRGVYTKLRTAGTAFEWCPAFEVNFPAGTGNLMAVREWNGIPIFITEYAIYQVSGDGPNNAGLNGSFSSPIKIADTGCTSLESVVVTPVGIMWQHNRDFILFNGQPQVITQVSADFEIAGTTLLRNQGEVVFWSRTSTVKKVFNYIANKWSVWDDQTHPYPVQSVVNVPTDANLGLIYSKQSGQIYRIDGASTSDCQSMVFETDHTLLGGEFSSSCVLKEIIFTGSKSAGPHGIRLDLFVDQEPLASTTRSWSVNELQPYPNVYTLKVEPRVQVARCFKLRITDDISGQPGSAGLRPRTVTYRYEIDNLIHEEAFLTGSIK